MLEAVSNIADRNFELLSKDRRVLIEERQDSPATSAPCNAGSTLNWYLYEVLPLSL